MGEPFRGGDIVLVGARNKTAGEEAASKLVIETYSSSRSALSTVSAFTKAAAQSITDEFGHLDIMVKTTLALFPRRWQSLRSNLEAITRQAGRARRLVRRTFVAAHIPVAALAQ